MASKHARVSIEPDDDRLTRTVFLPADTKFEKRIRREKKYALCSFVGTIVVIIQFFIFFEMILPHAIS
uniref:Small membrane protein n=1 Tax=Caenorhabditis tropicalis TaxID=1561998 RepID=A0A1I7TRT6_9PELO